MKKFFEITQGLSATCGRFAIAGMAVISFLGTGTLAAAGGNKVPASASMRDAAGDKIASDGLGPYDDQQNCVSSYVQGTMYFLRTDMQPSTGCPPQRTITLDFSDSVTPPADCSVFDPNSGLFLDACGSNVIVDVRLIASSLFKTKAPGTSVKLPFSLKQDFRNTAFYLEFELAVPFTGSGDLRVLEAGPDAVAELYQGDVSIGRYRMPFQLTVVKH